MDADRFLLVGGQPLREPVARYGPFVMNEEAQIIEAIEDYRAGAAGAHRADRTVSGQERQGEPGAI